MINNIKIVWLTYNDRHVWLEEFLTYNPHIDYEINNTISDKENSKNDWRNCDRSIRLWWRNNYHRCSNEYILFLEYDVLVNANIYDFFKTPCLGITTRFSRVLSRGDKWFWFRERDKLGGNFSDFAGADPFGVILFHRNALDEIIKPEYDSLYDDDIFCELRTPTILLNSGFELNSNCLITDVNVRPMSYTTNHGIYHKVK